MRLRRFAEHKPRSRMRLGVHVALVLVVAVVSAAVIGAVLWWLLGRPPLRQAGGWTTANSFEFAKIVLALIGGVGAVVALVIAYRKQHLGEAAEQREDIKLFAERFTKASDQLGSDKAPVRLAGMYALEDLAQGTPSQRQTTVNVLCAYLRMPYDLPERSKNAATEQTESETDAQRFASGEHTASATLEVRKQELQVRLTAQRILADHLRPGPSSRNRLITYWGRPDADIDIDLTGATLIDFDLTGCRIGIDRFDGAMFSGHATFREAMFSGDTSFIGSMFSEYAWFSEATFGGDASFTETAFSQDATFSKAIFGGEAWFGDAVFSEDARFAEVMFSGYARFRKAIFSGDAGFDNVTFGGNAWFVEATFSANAWFVEATFSGDAWFMEATFSGDAGFDKTTFNAHGFSPRRRSVGTPGLPRRRSPGPQCWAKHDFG
jgi:uncharacterized protein YjbI with pentapeptide repeats